jgi:ankyrin repeat protein
MGHEGVVKLLLGMENVDLNPTDVDGRTPLGCAAINGHEGVVKLLLEREDVDPDKPDIQGATPLLLAAYNGHARV